MLIADVSEYLWGLQWPKIRRIEDIIVKFMKNIEEMLKLSHVWLIFDRYFDYSMTRLARSSITRGHVITLTTLVFYSMR